jgi:hypothetical protein
MWRSTSVLSVSQVSFARSAASPGLAVASAASDSISSVAVHATARVRTGETPGMLAMRPSFLSSVSRRIPTYRPVAPTYWRESVQVKVLEHAHFGATRSSQHRVDVV